jgi:integral membrane sensor domain MASE1
MVARFLAARPDEYRPANDDPGEPQMTLADVMDFALTIAIGAAVAGAVICAVVGLLILLHKGW